MERGDVYHVICYWRYTLQQFFCFWNFFAKCQTQKIKGLYVWLEIPGFKNITKYLERKKIKLEKFSLHFNRHVSVGADFYSFSPVFSRSKSFLQTFQQFRLNLCLGWWGNNATSENWKGRKNKQFTAQLASSCSSSTCHANYEFNK